MKIQEIDPNFKVERRQDGEFTMVSARKLTVEGFPWLEEDGEFLRMPRKTLESLRPSLTEMCYACAGGAVRFETDSKRIALRSAFRKRRISSGMPYAADAGVDLYRKTAKGWVFVNNLRPEPEEQEIDMVVQSDADGKNLFMLLLPLYSGLEDLWVGVEQGACIEPAEARPMSQAVLFYGSSVTNGGCASRPGMTYPAIVTRESDVPMVNMGYSGNARGDRAVAEAIAAVHPGVLVMEYDHNAPSPEELRATHEPFYRIIRAQNPEMPVIFLSRPVFAEKHRAGADAMRAVITETYEKAKKAGEKVYFIDGSALFAGNATDYTVDNIHPNDLGFRVMADAVRHILDTLK